jgi:hypothetical protein
MTATPSRPPEDRAVELLSALVAVLPELPASALLDLRSGLVQAGELVLLRLLREVTPVTPVTPGPDPVLTLEETAAFLRRSRSWIFHNWKRLRLGFRDGGRVRFRQRDLDRYVASQRRGL